MSIAQKVEELKPSEIRVLKSKESVTFIVNGQSLRATLNEQTYNNVMFICKEHKFLTKSHQTQDEFIFEFDWTSEKMVNEVEMKISKIIGNPDEEDIHTLYERAYHYMTIQHSLEMTLTSSGKSIIDNVITDFQFNPHLIKEIHTNAASESYKHIGSIEQEVDLGDTKLTVISSRVGDEVTATIRVALTDFSVLKIPMANEMKHRLSSIETGIIACARHPIVGMEYLISIMTSFDSNFLDLCAQVGDNMLVTDLPTITTRENFDLLKGTHYRYVIISEPMIKDIGMNEIFDLMLSGKTIILSYTTHSIYSLLFNLKDSIKTSEADEEHVMINTVGFIYPNLAIDANGKLTLDQTESVTLTTTKVKDIISNSVSRERFVTWVEFPALVYGLGSSKKFLTQEEEFNQLLRQAIEQGTSDIHLAVGAKPKFRIQGVLRDVEGANPLTARMMDHLCSVLVKTELHQTILEHEKQLYLPYSVHGLGRFRMQISTQRGTRSIVCRHTTSRIPTIDETRLPQPVVDAMLENPKGLIIISGPTGSGKSTTSAVLIDTISKSAPYAVVSLADPIEYLHSHGQGIVTQREIPSDVKSYEEGLMSVFRSDPDIIEVAEMRSPESVAATLRFASSGHLVITTWHSASVLSTLTSLLSRVEVERANELREILSQNLIAIVNQTLVQDVNGNRYPIFEYLIPDHESRTYILENQTKKFVGHLKSIASTGKPNARFADYELIKAHRRGIISEEVRDKYLLDKSNLDDVINDAF